MNKHKHIDLKPHIDSICNYLGITTEELKVIIPSNQPDLKRRFVISYLYYNIGSTYQNIANEFGISIPNVFRLIKSTNERLEDGCPKHLEFEQKIKSYINGTR